MLHASKPLTSGKVQSYYRSEYSAASNSYFTQEGTLQGHWHGQLASKLGLSGSVPSEAFDRLAEGQHPQTGEQLIQHRDTIKTQTGEEVGHRAGWDFTFNAPKTVSLTALVGQDERVRDAHRIAVTTALDALENYVQARMGGDRASENTGKWIAATFEHDTARPVDGYPAPHLHTHVIVFNMTEDATGQARSLQPYELFRVQSMATAVYQNKLEQSLRDIGYRIERGTNHAPDIKGYTMEYLDAESLRAAQLHKEMEERGLGGRDAIVQMAHQNREEKLKVTPEQLRAIHQQHAEEHGNQPHKVVEEVGNARGKMITPEAAEQRAQAAVTFARNRLAERSSVFEHFEVIRDALRHTLGRATLEDIQAEVAKQTAEGKLIQVSHLRPNAPAFRYTTPEQLEIERQTIEFVRNGIGKCQPMSTADYTHRYGQKLNEDQLRLVHQALSFADQVFGVQGKAGTGKTTALRVVHALAEEHGYKVHGLGPTSQATKGLKEAGIQSETLQMYLTRPLDQDLADARSRLILLDESSLASGKQMRDFLQTIRPDDRVILIGDTKQHQSVGAGRIFEELQDAGMPVARLEKIVRQKEEGLRQVVEALAEGRIIDGVNLLSEQGRIETIEHRGDRFQAIAEAFAESPEGTLVISPDNQSRHEINDAIRAELKERGLLKEDTFTLPILKGRQQLTREDRMVAASYHLGDSVRYNRGSEVFGLKPKSYATVIDIEPEINRITVQKENGKLVTYDPTRLPGVAIYEPEIRSFAVGERIQFLTPWKDKAIGTRDLGTITHLDKDGNVRVALDDSNRVVGWNLNRNKHLDYAYAMTSHSAQGITVDRSLIQVDTGDTRVQALVNEALAYVAGSRPRYDARIFTDNAEKLGKALSRSNQNTTALSQEQVREYAGMGI